MMKPFAVAGMPQRDFPARVRRVEHMATMLPMTAACPGVMVRCSERAGSKAIFAKRTHLKIKLNPTGSNLVKPGQTWSNQFVIKALVGFCQNVADGLYQLRHQIIEIMRLCPLAGQCRTPCQRCLSQA